MQRLAGLFHDDMDAHWLLEVDAVVIDEALGLEPAVRPFGDRSLELRLRRFEQAIEAGLNFLPAEPADQLVETFLAQAVGAELAADVAEHQLRRAAVGAD